MILSINTSTIQFSSALMQENGAILAEYFTSPGSKNFSGLMPAIDYLLTTSKSNTKNIKAIIVAIGPGRFTGLRVGLAAAKGIAKALQIPIIGVSSLEALASQLPHTSYPVCPVLDSRKGEVFTALFNWSDDHEMVRVEKDTCLKIDELPSFIRETTLLLGNDFNRQGHVIAEMIGHKALLALPPFWGLKASAVGNAGLKRFHEQYFDELKDLVPFYMRSPDIRPNPFPLISPKQCAVLQDKKNQRH